MKRNEGYYWIKFDNEWIIGYYSKSFNTGIWTIGEDIFEMDESFQEIDEKQIKKE